MGRAQTSPEPHNSPTHSLRIPSYGTRQNHNGHGHAGHAHGFLAGMHVIVERDWRMHVTKGSLSYLSSPCFSKNVLESGVGIVH